MAETRLDNDYLGRLRIGWAWLMRQAEAFNTRLANPKWGPDYELEGRESPNYIAVYKPGLTELVKELEEYRKILVLEGKLPKEKPC